MSEPSHISTDRSAVLPAEVLKYSGDLSKKDAGSQRFLMVGSEWLAELPGGLSRYFSGLLSFLIEEGFPTRGLVMGPADGAPPEVKGVGNRRRSLQLRLRETRRAVLRWGSGATLVDVHFALYALPVLSTPLRRLPLVVHFQGPWADESAGPAAGTLSIATKKAIEGFVYRRASQCVVLSRSFARILVERYRVSPWKINVIPPGVDLDLFCPSDQVASRRRTGLPADAWIALAARRLVARTGVDDLIRAWSKLDHPGSRNRILVVAGEGPLEEELRHLADDLGVSSSVRFLGKVTDETLADLYRGADVCVVPSVALEGFGLVVLESMACGTPVIATRTGGLPEAVGAPGERLLAEPGDPESLARSLQAALRGEGLPDRKACRSYAEKFSWDRVGPRNLEVYRKAVKAPAVRRPRVVFLDHVARLSGGELALLRLVKAMKGIDAHVILAENGPLADKLTAAGISVEIMEMGEAGRGLSREDVRPGLIPLRSNFGSVAYVLRLAAWLRKLKPDLIHTNSLKAAFYGVPASRLAGVPCVWHLRDSLTADYVPAPAARLIRAMARKLPAGIIANSQSTLSNLGPIMCPAAVIGSPVDKSFERFDSSGREPEVDTTGKAVLRIGMVGRITPWKGQDIFLKGFAGAFPDDGHEALIAGSPLFGEKDFQGKLAGLVAELGLNGRVQFAGFVEDIPGFLAKLDILVHSSKTPEPFGLAVVEGMAAGLPVVAAAAGGPAEFIEDGVNGLLYPPGDVNALAASLRKLAADPALRFRLGQAAQVKARDFAVDKIASQVLDFYQRLGIGSSIRSGNAR